MKILATSDWHLDKSTAGVDRYDDICKAIDVSVDAACELDVDVYLMDGDLTDPDTVRAMRAVHKALQVQRRLNVNGIVPVFVAGNHDVIEDGSGMTTLSPLAATGLGYVFERPMMVAWPTVTLIALPFTATSHDYDPAEFIHKCHQAGEHTNPVLIVGHLNAEGISPGSETTEMPRGRNVYWPLDAIEECFPDALVVGGHYHTPQQYKQLHIVGSMARLRFDECDNETGYLVMEV